MGSHRSSSLPASAPQVTAILDSFRGITRALRVASRKAESRVGLSAAQLFVLHKLADAPAASLNELAQRTHTHQSSVSAVVQRLVARRLVLSAPATTDGRRRELRLTAAGRGKLRGETGLVQDRLITAIQQISAARRQRLAGDLAAIANALHADAPAPAMFFEDEARTTRQTSRMPRRGRRSSGESPLRRVNVHA